MIPLKRFILICMLSAFGALSSFAQYFNRTIIDPKLTKSHIWQVFGSGDEVYCNLEKRCFDNRLCSYFTQVSSDGKDVVDVGNTELQGFLYTMAIRNDTVFYSSTSYSQDSFTVWHFGMMDRYGNKIKEYQYKILHFKDTYLDKLAYKTPINYGLALVNNNEVILWGEGMDNKLPNPKDVSRRSIFLRVGLDGIPRGDIFWFDENDIDFRRMSDAVTDIDGNMVFIYENVNDQYVSRRSLFKVMPDNKIVRIAELFMTDIRRNLPKVAIDSKGDFYINPIFLSGNLPGYNVSSDDVGWISKIDRSGKEVWRRFIPPFHPDFLHDKKAEDTYKISRIATTKDNGVLVTSEVFVKDSFLLTTTMDSIHDTGFGSTIARFDTDGNLLWRHFIIPKKKDGTIRNNYLYDIKEMEDGSILVGGYIERDDDDVDPRYITDAWIMRLTAKGCLTEDCEHIGKYFDFLPEIVSTSDDATVQNLTIYPNPGSSEVNIEVPSGYVLPVQYQITDIQGRILETGIKTDSKISLDMSFLTAGLYIIMVRDVNGKVTSGKWVRE